MEKFVIKGKGSNSDYTFGVAIPKAKHFHIQAVFKGEKKLQVQHVINDAEQIKHKDMFGLPTYKQR